MPLGRQANRESIKTYVLEEAYEVADAVERRSPEEVCHELGDLLFQVLFMASIYKGSGDFDLYEVLETIRKKMVRRHPTCSARRGQQRRRSGCELGKDQEEELGLSEGARWPLEKVPENLPALLRAHRLIERAAKHRLLAPGDEERWSDIQNTWGTLNEAVKEGIGSGSQQPSERPCSAWSPWRGSGD